MQPRPGLAAAAPPCWRTLHTPQGRGIAGCTTWGGPSATGATATAATAVGPSQCGLPGAGGREMRV